METKKLKATTELRKYKKYSPPQPRNRDLPPTYNIVLSSSTKNSGKTYNIVQMLTNYELSGFVSEDGKDVVMRTIWLSGSTSHSKQNSILDSLTSLADEDRIDIDDNLDGKITEIYSELLLEKQGIELYNIYIDTYNRFIKLKDLSKLTTEELDLLEAKQFIDPVDDLDRPRDAKTGKFLEHPRMIFLILDDLIAVSNGFSTKRNNILNKLSTKSRHDAENLVPLNLVFISQNLKSIPPVIRKNVDLWVLLRTANKMALIDNISDEVGAYFTKDQLIKYYEYTCSIPYGSLIISLCKDENPKNRLRMGWDRSFNHDIDINN
jgi:hypothetical protein